MRINKLFVFFPILVLLVIIKLSIQNTKINGEGHQVEKSMIYGIWAENTEENANFWIKNDSVYFIEDLKNPISFEISNDTLIFYYDGVTTFDKILKQTDNSLILLNEFNEIIKLYKRK